MDGRAADSPPSPSEHTWKSFLPFLAAAPAGASVLRYHCNAEAATEVPSVISGAPWVPVGEPVLRTGGGEPAYAGGLALLPVSCSCGSSSHPSSFHGRYSVCDSISPTDVISSCINRDAFQSFDCVAGARST